MLVILVFYHVRLTQNPNRNLNPNPQCNRKGVQYWQYIYNKVVAPPTECSWKHCWKH